MLVIKPTEKQTMGKLTVKKVEGFVRAGVPGKHTDTGGERGLMLCIEGKHSAAWVLRYQRDHVVRHMGLGSVRTADRAGDRTLSEAREAAHEARNQLRDGIDPLAERRRKRDEKARAEAKRITFKEAAHRFHAAKEAEWTNDRHRDEFISSLERYAFAHVGALDVAAIDRDAVLRVLEQKLKTGGTFWLMRPTTADRVRNRIERVLDFATARGFRSGDNPARWKGFLDTLLPKPSKVAPVKNLAAVPYDQVPAVMAVLAADATVAAKALAFIIMTASRMSEALDATWGAEVDLANAVWTVPATRMKSRREHCVPLSPQVVALLRSLPREDNNPHLFISSKTAGKAVTEMTVTAALRRAGRSETVHGFRSSFRDWCGDRTGVAREVAEAALAHAVGDKAEQAYRRGSALEKRRRLMQQWATFCCTPATTTKADVVPMRARDAAR
jgi:integrase